MAAVMMNHFPNPPHGRRSDPIDVLVGQRIRKRRLLLGMSLGTLANALGITFQQVQKYELGANRVSASRLAGMANVLRVPISYFFGDIRAATPSGRLPPDLMEQPDTIELIRLYHAIRDETVRLKALAIVQAIAEASATRREPRHGRPPGPTLNK